MGEGSPFRARTWGGPFPKAAAACRWLVTTAEADRQCQVGSGQGFRPWGRPLPWPRQGHTGSATRLETLPVLPLPAWSLFPCPVSLIHKAWPVWLFK